MKVNWKIAGWAAAGVGLLALLSRAASYTFGGASTATMNRDPSKLLPGFAKKLEVLFQRMRARGYSPMLLEGYRTPERAKLLAAKGTGIANSLHILGAAADIGDASTAPDYWKGKPGFWTALRQEAVAIGLTSGATFPKPDIDHVQAIPVREETAFRNATLAQRAEMVA